MNPIATVPTVTLSDGAVLPQVGLGVWKIPDADAPAVVQAALEVGYRSIDTAAAYGNEEGVGAGLRASDVPREDVMVTTKVWNSEQGFDRTVAACRASLERLGLDYLDLYLIHWPAPAKNLYVETWRAMIELRADGLVRSIGVCNFEPSHLTRLVEETGVAPTVNQVELHPLLQQPALRAAHEARGVVTEAWSPLAQGGMLLRHPALVALAERRGVSVAQAILRWHVQLGNVVIPKSANPERIAQNIDIFGFELDEGEMAAIAELDADTRLGPHPDRFE